MIKAVNCAALSTALEQLKEIVIKNEENGQRTVVFCEDRLSLAAERAVCSAVGGTFLTSVYTFARFLSAEAGKGENILSAQGSAMAVRKIIEDKKDELLLFKRLSAAGAAQSVYDTIALLYSSRISPDDVLNAANGGGILGGKLHDLAIIYSAYVSYLKERGFEDRNGYLKQLAPVIENSAKIRGSFVVFLGFQAFTCTVTECARAAFSAAESVCGLFIGGSEDIYVNEASAAFSAAAEDFGGAEISVCTGKRNDDAEKLRRCLFNPESFYYPPAVSSRVHVYEASDEEEELEFVAASIKKHVIDGNVRYAKISVMLPDMDVSERLLARVFKRYRIPYYADRRRDLSEHALCDFIVNYLLCVIYGCRPGDVDGVVSSPYFGETTENRDIFRNYALRLASYRGGVKREPKKEICEELGFDVNAVETVRKKFLQGLYVLTANGGKTDICGGIKELLNEFGVEEKIKSLAEDFKAEYPAEAEFGLRAYDGVMSVLDEIKTLTDGDMPLKEFVKILKSGFSAMKISLIPPKADAVFVGDLAATANTGSNVVFAVRLTGDVPGASPDCALLTDREISALESVNLNISPKIRQVNARRKETVALNICAFRKHLYLTYPVRFNGEESAASEIILYAEKLFVNSAGENIKPAEIKKLERDVRYIPYYCSEPLPAARLLQKFRSGAEADSVYEVLCRRGYKEQADAAVKKAVNRGISRGEKLYLTYGSISPTALETYFSCPYLSFMRQGLKVREREDGTVRAVDTGNFIHSVLQDLAPQTVNIRDDCELETAARKIAGDKLCKPPYSSLTDTKSGQYTANELVDEAVKVSKGMFAQLKNSTFSVAATECVSEITLDGGIKIYGRIDRVDQSGDMVRVIDYKTGTIDAAAVKYYTGTKLQLPLYLLSVSGGKRAVGTYYFPASVEFKEKRDGVFRLQGFMDGSDEVVAASDTGVKPKSKSDYVDAYLGKSSIDSAMSSRDFADFLQYARLVAGKGAAEMIGGNVTPSPTETTCKYCKAGGSCGFAVGRDGEARKINSVKCSEIAALVRNVKGDTDE